jgi:hypothetical protein
VTARERVEGEQDGRDREDDEAGVVDPDPGSAMMTIDPSSVAMNMDAVVLASATHL